MRDVLQAFSDFFRSSVARSLSFRFRFCSMSFECELHTSARFSAYITLRPLSLLLTISRVWTAHERTFLSLHHTESPSFSSRSCWISVEYIPHWTAHIPAILWIFVTSIPIFPIIDRVSFVKLSQLITPLFLNETKVSFVKLFLIIYIFIFTGQAQWAWKYLQS